jgi:hypothetical protein
MKERKTVSLKLVDIQLWRYKLCFNYYVLYMFYKRIAPNTFSVACLYHVTHGRDFLYFSSVLPIFRVAIYIAQSPTVNLPLFCEIALWHRHLLPLNKNCIMNFLRSAPPLRDFNPVYGLSVSWWYFFIISFFLLTPCIKLS